MLGGHRQQERGECELFMSKPSLFQRKGNQVGELTRRRGGWRRVITAGMTHCASPFLLGGNEWHFIDKPDWPTRIT